MGLKANELRIGNLLNTVNGIKKVSNISVDGYCWFTDNQCEAIPLTEEWLIKLGNYEISPFKKGIIIFERFLFQWKNEYKYWYVMERYSLSYLTKIEFVHEYQNFIFALTGKELSHQKIN